MPKVKQSTRKVNQGIINPHRISVFFGLNTSISDIKSMPDGYAPDAMNWITGNEKDCIILRRGSALLGKTRIEGAGKITGLGVGTKYNGVQIPFFSYGRKVKYYNLVADDNIEIGTDLLPIADDEVSIFPYQNLLGAYIYLSSINSSIYKIPVANPGSAVDQSSTTYRGFLKFGQSRSILINRYGTNGFKDLTGLYMSYVDKANLNNYTQVTNEAVGSSGSQNYTHTLVQITGKRTAGQVQVVATVAAGTETFNDDKNGVLTSNYSGTGTVNYATGAINVTFSAVTTGNVTCSYYYEDATIEGVCDFSFASPRVAGSGRYFSQFDGGGSLNSVFPLANIFYCFHELKTWQTSIPTDDDDVSGSAIATNLPFREKMGVSYPYSAFGSTSEIWYINNANPNNPEIYALRLFTGATAANIASPQLISEVLNLSNYAFNKAVVFDWGNYLLVCCQQIRNGVADDFNSRTFVYNKRSGVWDLLDYPSSRLAEYNGTLIAGDSISNNVYTLFSGFDDDGEIIQNYWTSGQTNHGIEGQKRCNKMVVDGLIQQAQNIKVSISYDGGNFVDIYTIEGTGSYVDTGKSIAVGSYVLGSKILGGGATVYANPFQIEFPLNSDRYEYIRVRFEAIGGGYTQINFYEFKDIRYKSHKVMPARMV
ncbi:MAG: hypothetical protein QMD65_02005 [Patescibacteria group bacterium]|nr:hypothetical protein [Patescibacteria group bacterium]